MNDKRLGRQTVALAHPPSVLSFANIGGKFEGQGPLADYFDEINPDSSSGKRPGRRRSPPCRQPSCSGRCRRRS